MAARDSSTSRPYCRGSPRVRRVLPRTPRLCPGSAAPPWIPVASASARFYTGRRSSTLYLAVSSVSSSRPRQLQRPLTVYHASTTALSVHWSPSPPVGLPCPTAYIRSLPASPCCLIAAQPLLQLGLAQLGELQSLLSVCPTRVSPYCVFFPTANLDIILRIASFAE